MADQASPVECVHRFVAKGVSLLRLALFLQ